MRKFEFLELKPSDVQDSWQSWYNSDHTKHYTRSGRSMDVVELRHSIEVGNKEGNQFTLGIVDTSTNATIGTAKLGPIDRTHGLADLAILIGDSNYLGKGLSSQLIAQASALAFSKYQVRKLHGGILAGNIPSLKAYTRAGWVAEGVLRGHYRNNGKVQDWILISKHSPDSEYFDGNSSHAIDLNPYLNP